jgi:hypothetical protein
MEPDSDSAEASRVLRELSAYGPVLAVKLYRIVLEPRPSLPILPCLDHEAMIHEGVSPHVAAYVQDGSSGDIHELVCVPREHRIELDTMSTWGEASAGSRDRLLAAVAERFPEYAMKVIGPSWWRGDTRVAVACRAQVTLRDVLLGSDVTTVKAGIERLQAIASLMEKQSRVASWGVRTVTGTVLAAAAFVLFAVFGFLTPTLGEGGVTNLRYGLISVLGAIFLYYGMKAVQLTEMSNRVWKRTAEYNLILTERKRLGV